MAPSLRRVGWVGCLLFIALPARAQTTSSGEPRPTSKPRLVWSKPIWCVTDAKGREFRVQDQLQADGTHLLLIAPNEEASGRPLSRTADCSRGNGGMDAIGPNAARSPRVSAIAEAPPGWYRDEQGRVFQVSFDLRRRFYLGAGWKPALGAQGEGQAIERAYVDMGLEASWLRHEARTRHTIRALNAHATFDDLEAEGTFFSWEMVHASTTPLLRITTFFGTPRRYDTKMDMGFGARLLSVHHRPHRDDDLTDLEIGEGHVAWYPWHSDDLYDSVRITLGGNGGATYRGGGELRDGQFWVGPRAGLELFGNLDRDGFHYLHGRVQAGLPVAVGGTEAGKMRTRARAEVGYEVIFLAINDQPLSLRTTAALDQRDDVQGQAPELEASAFTGLRFSFWAPARDRTPLTPAYQASNANDVGTW